MILPVWVVSSERSHRQSTYAGGIVRERRPDGTLGGLARNAIVIGPTFRPIVRKLADVTVPALFRQVKDREGARGIGRAVGAALYKDVTIAILLDERSEARGIVVAFGRRDHALEGRGFARAALADDAVCAVVLVVVRLAPAPARVEPYDRLVAAMTRGACKAVGIACVDHLVESVEAREASPARAALSIR